MKKQYVLGGLLILVLAASLLATSFVSARNYVPQDVMSAPFVSIPEGSTHYGYDGNYISSDKTIGLGASWTVNLPPNTCAIAARLAFKDNAVNKYASLRPSATDAFAVLARTQVVNQWVDDSGIIPINTYPPTVRLDINSAGYVFIEITGYWVCDDYAPTPRPTLAP